MLHFIVIAKGGGVIAKGRVGAAGSREASITTRIPPRPAVVRAGFLFRSSALKEGFKRAKRLFPESRVTNLSNTYKSTGYTPARSPFLLAIRLFSSR